MVRCEIFCALPTLTLSNGSKRDPPIAGRLSLSLGSTVTTFNSKHSIFERNMKI